MAATYSVALNVVLTPHNRKQMRGGMQVECALHANRAASSCLRGFLLSSSSPSTPSARRRSRDGASECGGRGVLCLLPEGRCGGARRRLKAAHGRKCLRGVATASAAASPAMDDGFSLHPAVKEGLGKLSGSHAPPLLSDIVWSASGGFVAMAAMGYLDKLLLPKGLSFGLGSFGAVCTLLFAARTAPVASRYNVFVSHMFCALTGVVALAAFGPGWLAKATALAACIAFMQYTGSIHPPAAGLPLIFIDGAKWHSLKWWYVLFPGVVGCLFLFVLAEIVEFLKKRFRF